MFPKRMVDIEADSVDPSESLPLVVCGPGRSPSFWIQRVLVPAGVVMHSLVHEVIGISHKCGRLSPGKTARANLFASAAERWIWIYSGLALGCIVSRVPNVDF